MKYVGGLLICIVAVVASGQAEATKVNPRIADPLADLVRRLNSRGGRALNITSQGYTGNATLWTPVTQTWPSVLLQPATAADVADCVQTLQQARLPFRIRGSGHSYAGHSSHTGPVIDTRLLAAVQVTLRVYGLPWATRINIPRCRSIQRKRWSSSELERLGGRFMTPSLVLLSL